MLWRHFLSGATISKGNIPVEKPLRRPLTFALTGVFGERIGEVRSERGQDGQLKLALRRRVIDVFRERNECGMLLCQDTEALQRHHDVARPAIQGMYHDHLHAPGLDILQQFLKGRAFGDLLPPGAAFVILVEDRGRKPPPCTLVNDCALLCIDAEVLLLHPAGSTHIASNDERWFIKQHVHGTPRSLALLRLQGHQSMQWGSCSCRHRYMMRASSPQNATISEDSASACCVSSDRDRDGCVFIDGISLFPRTPYAILAYGD